MSRTKKIIMWVSISLVTLTISVFSFGYWFMSLIPTAAERGDITATTPSELPYLTRGEVPFRGKILMVVTSADKMGSTGKRTGYELTELARPYYVFQANGFEVDVASPLGGKAPAVIDKEDMGVFDYAFLNDPEAQAKANETFRIEEINPTEYEAIFFAGGKGAMFDFPQNTAIQSLISDHYQSGKVVGAVCHGPAALVNVTLDNGTPLVAGKSVTSFTNAEELFLIPDAPEVFPFLLQDKLEQQGAHFNDGQVYLENVALDGNLITGQNPWSTWTVAEAMISELGYTPKKRTKSGEENAVRILSAYEADGYDLAYQMIDEMTARKELMDRTLIAMHGIVAAMQWEIGKSIDLISLVNVAKQRQKI